MGDSFHKMITWITGESGSGKTTLAKKLIKLDGGIHLDGDQMRTCWKLGFTLKDRAENNLRIAKIARILSNQGFNVIISTICPTEFLKLKVKLMTNCRMIRLDGGTPWQS